MNQLNTNKMKKLIIYFSILLLVPMGYSTGIKIQRGERFKTDYAIGLFGGVNFSTFDFHKSNGQRDNGYDFIRGNNYGINFIISNGYHVFRPELSFHKNGAKYIYDGIPMQWETSYFNVNLTYLFNLVRSKYDFLGFGAAPYSIRVGASLGFNYMTSGIQTNGETQISIVQSGSLLRYDLTASGITTFGVKLTDLLAVNVEYRFNFGLLQIEMGTTNQKTHNLYHTFVVAIYHKLQ
jgi:hypothetical protein